MDHDKRSRHPRWVAACVLAVALPFWACGWVVDQTGGYAGSWCAAVAPLNYLFCDSFDEGPSSLEGGLVSGNVEVENEASVSPPGALLFSVASDGGVATFSKQLANTGLVHCSFDVLASGVPEASRVTVATIDLNHDRATVAQACMGRVQNGAGTRWVVSSHCQTPVDVVDSERIVEPQTLTWHHVDMTLGPADGGLGWTLTGNVDDAGPPISIQVSDAQLDVTGQAIQVGIVEVEIDDGGPTTLDIDNLVCSPP